MFLERSFFERRPLDCARELVGCHLQHGECRGVIVETEAYAAVNDEACHTFSRKAARLFVAGHDAGSAYVYLNYGMHWMLNVLVKGASGEEGFVLLRAVEPVAGLELMRQRRGPAARELCSGPGKLAQAFGITGSDHGRDFCGGTGLGFLQAPAAAEVIADVRIGVSRAADLPWRFLLKGSAAVSVRASFERKKKTRPV